MNANPVKPDFEPRYRRTLARGILATTMSAFEFHRSDHASGRQMTQRAKHEAGLLVAELRRLESETAAKQP